MAEKRNARGPQSAGQRFKSGFVGENNGTTEKAQELMRAEEAVAASLIELGTEILPRYVNLVLRDAPHSFDDQRYGHIAEAVKQLRQDGEQVDLLSVSKRLNGILDREFVGELAQRASLPVDLAEYEAQSVWEAFQGRHAHKLFSEAADTLQESPHCRHSIISNVRGELDRLQADQNHVTLADRRFDAARPPTRARSVYKLSNVTISTSGNLTAITAQAKAGKSAFVGAMIASAMIRPDSEADTLGLESVNPGDRALLHLDTEQTPQDHHELILRAMRRAGVGDPPGWLQSYCLTGMSAKEVQAALNQLLRECYRQFGGVHSVLVDGIADLATDVNDPAECNALVTHWHDLAIKFDTPIIGVIHLNPNSEKTRGHLGSHLERKAETNIQMLKEDETTMVWTTKQRRAPILKSDAPCFKWDSETGMHKTCETVREAKEHQRAEEGKAVVADIFRDRPSMRYADIITAVRTDMSVSHRHAERKVREYVTLNLITKNFGGYYVPNI